MFFASAYRVPILDQLRLEEALLRTSNHNYCLAVHGSSPSIVMGAFGKASSLIHLEEAYQQQIPIIRRYSGGGTVVVDENTLFLCFILEKGAFNFEAYPKSLMQWVYELLKPLFEPYNLLWVDNDFCLQHEGKVYKVAGNAQSITSTRMVHHISFPWHYEPELMALLKMPSQRPAYRENRSHKDFLLPLSKTSLSIELLINRLIQRLQGYTSLQIKDYTELHSARALTHRQATCLEKFPESSAI